jgi:DNA-binding IscR family transcriptional regulator
MKDVRDAIAEILDHTSLADMVERGRAGSAQRGLVYDI